MYECRSTTSARQGVVGTTGQSNNSCFPCGCLPKTVHNTNGFCRAPAYFAKQMTERSAKSGALRGSRPSERSRAAAHGHASGCGSRLDHCAQLSLPGSFVVKTVQNLFFQRYVASPRRKTTTRERRPSTCLFGLVPLVQDLAVVHADFGPAVRMHMVTDTNPPDMASL